jgi:hypothetical protein
VSRQAHAAPRSPLPAPTQASWAAPAPPTWELRGSADHASDLDGVVDELGADLGVGRPAVADRRPQAVIAASPHRTAPPPPNPPTPLDCPQPATPPLPTPPNLGCDYCATVFPPTSPDSIPSRPYARHCHRRPPSGRPQDALHPIHPDPRQHDSSRQRHSHHLRAALPHHPYHGNDPQVGPEGNKPPDREGRRRPSSRDFLVAQLATAPFSQCHSSARIGLQPQVDDRHLVAAKRPLVMVAASPACQRRPRAPPALYRHRADT